MGAKVKRLVWMFLCLGVFLGPIVRSLPVAQAVEYENIGGRPARPDPKNPRTESIFVHTIDPGKTVEDAVKVINYTNQPKTLLIYAADSIISSGGAFACAQKIEAKNEVGKWTNISKGEVSLGPQSDTIVPFSITVPKDADVGEHNGCLVIQEKDTPGQKVEGSSGGNIQLSFRTALRLAILVPGDIVKKLSISGYSVSKKAARTFVLKPEVKNEGNVSLDADLVTTVSYIWGRPAAEYKQQYPVLKGIASSWNNEFKGPFWGGLFKSRFSVSYDTNTGNTIGSQSDKKITTLTSKNIYFFSPPHPLALAIEILALLLIVATITMLYLYLKRRRQIKRTWVDYKLSRNETINNLAKRYGVSWKLLAKTNNLKPPYALRKGDEIKVPPKKKKTS